MQQAGTDIYKVDDMEFGRRLAVERELEKDLKAGATMNAVWDESGNFLIYPTMLGIKGELGVCILSSLLKQAN
jgi:peptidylprolyl isomerase domain and WD repeat-containing protein 1